MKNKEWIIFVAILVVGIVIHSIGKFEKPFWLNYTLGKYSGSAIIYNEDRAILVAPDCMLEVIDNIGDVNLKGYEGNQMIIHWKKMFFNTNKLNVDKVIKELSLSVQQEVNLIKISTNSFDVERKYGIGIKNGFEISIPQGCSSRIINRMGEVRIAGVVSKAYIENSYGDVVISNVGNDVSVKTFFGSAFLKDISGMIKIISEYTSLEITNAYKPVILESKYSKIMVTNLKADLIANSKFGFIEGKNIGGKVGINARHIDLNLEQIDKLVKIDVSFSDVKVSGAKDDVEIGSKHSPINIANVSGNVFIRGSHKDIEVQNIGGWCKIIGEHSLINVSNLHAGLYLRNSFEDVSLENIVGASDVENHHSDISIKLTEINYFRFNVNAKYGDVRVVLPSDDFALEGYAYRGEIKSKYSDDFLLVEKKDDSYRAHTINRDNENKLVKIKSYYGDIIIEKKSGAVVWLENRIMLIWKFAKSNIERVQVYFEKGLLNKILLIIYRLLLNLY